jgi:FMN-dependent NADH-azoreductase
MGHVLFVTSSLNGERSRSLGIAREFLARYPHTSLTHREIAPASMPHYDGETIAALGVPAAERTPRQREKAEFADALIEEIEAADTVVLAAPMYNFSIPSTLKAWIDHIARAGRTFRYTATGPEGLLKGKKVFVVTARGGHYANGGPASAYDFQEPYLRSVLGFLGLDDVTFLHLEGLNISPEAAAQGLVRARAALAAIVPQQQAA